MEFQAVCEFDFSIGKCYNFGEWSLRNSGVSPTLCGQETCLHDGDVTRGERKTGKVLRLD